MTRITETKRADDWTCRPDRHSPDTASEAVTKDGWEYVYHPANDDEPANICIWAPACRGESLPEETFDPSHPPSLLPRHSDVVFFLIQYHEERMERRAKKTHPVTDEIRRAYKTKDWEEDPAIYRQEKKFLAIGSAKGVDLYFPVEVADEAEWVSLRTEQLPPQATARFIEALPEDLDAEHAVSHWGFYWLGNV